MEIFKTTLILLIFFILFSYSGSIIVFNKIKDDISKQNNFDKYMSDMTKLRKFKLKFYKIYYAVILSLLVMEIIWILIIII